MKAKRFIGALAAALAVLVLSPGARAAQVFFVAAEVDYSGVELVLTFEGALPENAHSHPWVKDTPVPVPVTVNGAPTTPKGGNFELMALSGFVPVEQVRWTLRYRIEPGDRIVYGQADPLVVWEGVLAEDGLGNSTAGGGYSFAATNRSRVNAQGWTVHNLRTDAGEPALTPDQVAGLRAWLRADWGTYTTSIGETPAVNDNDPVGLWETYEPIEPPLDFLQANEDRRPTLRTGMNGLNNLPVVEFNGSLLGSVPCQGLVGEGLTLSAAAGPVSYMAVVRFDNITQATRNMALFQRGLDANAYGHLSSDTHPSATAVTFGTAKTINTGGKAIQGVQQFIHEEWLIVGGSWEGPGGDGKVQVWNMGALEEDSNYSPNLANSAWVLGWNESSWCLDGAIAEVAIFDRAITDAEAKAMTTHFMAKYGIQPRELHVDPAGDDGNHGLSPQAPKKTPDGGTKKVRSGVGDRVLFRLGSEFSGGFGVRSGWSLEHPSLYSTYELPGDPPVRPVFKTFHDGGTAISGSGAKIQSVALVGLDLHSFERDPGDPGFRSDLLPNKQGGMGHPAGMVMNASTTSQIVIEDCVVRWYSNNITIERASTGDDIIIRRNIIRNAWSPLTYITYDIRPQGLYVEVPNATRILIEENLFHRNGWSSSEPIKDFAKPNNRCHNIYFAGGEEQHAPIRGIVVRENFSTYGASHGVQLRPGGVLDSNIFYKNAIHAFTSRSQEAGIVSDPSLVWRSLFLDARDLWNIGKPLAKPPEPGFWEGLEWGFDFNGGHDILLTESIFCLATKDDENDNDPTGHAIRFVARNFPGVDLDRRAFCRNNTVYIWQRAAVSRQTAESDTYFNDAVFDRNLIVQPTLLPPSTAWPWLADWEVRDLFEGDPPPPGAQPFTWTFAHNYYFSWGEPVDEWFKYVGQAESDWLGKTEPGGSPTSVIGSVPPTFDTTNPEEQHMGVYYEEMAGGDPGSSPENFINQKLRTRPRGEWPENLTARAVIDWFRGHWQPTNLLHPFEGAYYGAVPYPS